MAEDQVRADYDRARRKAFLRDLVSFFRREPNTLISYADVRDRVTMEGESYRGMQEVPVQAPPVCPAAACMTSATASAFCAEVPA